MLSLMASVLSWMTPFWSAILPLAASTTLYWVPQASLTRSTASLRRCWSSAPRPLLLASSSMAPHAP